MAALNCSGALLGEGYNLEQQLMWPSLYTHTPRPPNPNGFVSRLLQLGCCITLLPPYTATWGFSCELLACKG